MLKTYWDVVVKPYRWHVLGISALMFLVAGLDVATVGMGVPLIEAATEKSGASTNPVVKFFETLLVSAGYGHDRGKLIFILLILVSVVAIARGALFLSYRYGTTIIGQRIRRETKEKLMRKILDAQYAYLAKRSRGAIMYDINWPSLFLYQLINSLATFASNMVNSLLMIGFMVYLSPVATGTIALLGGGWFLLWRKILVHRVVEYGKKIYEYNQLLEKIDVDVIDGMRVVKSHNLQSKMIEIQHRILTDEILPRKRSTLFSQGLSFVNEVAAGIVLVALGGMAFGLGLFSLSFSKLVVLLLGVRKVTPALSSVGQSYLELGKELKNIQVLDDILTRTPQEEHGTETLNQIGSLTFQNVGFHYPVESGEVTTPVLKNVSFTLKKGEITAVVGPTGAGKSTLASLLLGFYDPTEGGIWVDNHFRFREISLSSWRQKVGYVSQDIFLFNESIRQNILLWDESVSENDMVQAAKRAQIHDFVETLPEGYDTIVGDRGMKLSGGQCQRIAMARAILKNPEILIFDEATSALDNITEKAVYDAIHSLRENAIVFIIAHRLSTIKDADQILVLEKGAMVEMGRHESLMNRSGVYSRLYQEGVTLIDGGLPV